MFKIRVKPNEDYPYKVYFNIDTCIDCFLTVGEAKSFVYGVQYGVRKYDEIMARLQSKEFSMSPVVEE
jgi:hypothetical protein